MHEQDVLNAEFVRTYMSTAFSGGMLVRRLDAEKQRKNAIDEHRAVPSKAKPTAVFVHVHAESVLSRR